MKLSAARIFVRDFGTAIAFYSGKLGLASTASSAEYGFCVFDVGQADLVVEVVADDAPEDDQVLVGRFTGLSFEVANAQERFEELRAIGVAFDGEPEEQAWGGVLATFSDPAGNRLQLVQYPVS